MPEITQTVYVDFDLSDYEDEIKEEYCNGNCLRGCYNDELLEYIAELDKSVCLGWYPCEKDLKEIVEDLNRIIRG